MKLYFRLRARPPILVLGEKEEDATNPLAGGISGRIRGERLRTKWPSGVVDGCASQRVSKITMQSKCN